jgi:hypothetical protein
MDNFSKVTQFTTVEMGGDEFEDFVKNKALFEKTYNES